MATIVLTAKQQEELGQRSTPLELTCGRLRRQALKDQQWEREWLEDDTLPDCSDRLSFEFFANHKKAVRGRKTWRGLWVIEFPDSPTSRSGEVIGLKYSCQYKQEMPIVQWLNGLISFSHPEVLVLQRQQLSLF